MSGPRPRFQESVKPCIDYNAGQACDVVIKVFTCVKTAWNRVRNMFATVLTTIKLYGDNRISTEKLLIFWSVYIIFRDEPLRMPLIFSIPVKNVSR